jgi:hypothetical protein
MQTRLYNVLFGSAAVTTLLCLAFSFAFTATSNADDAVWTIPLAQAECILDNRDRYAESAADVLIIIVNNCPDPSLFSGSNEGLQNYSGAASVQTGPSGELDTVISYSAEAFRCLTRESITIDGDVAILPQVLSCVE